MSSNLEYTPWLDTKFIKYTRYVKQFVSPNKSIINNERMFVLMNSLQSTLNLDGDVIECGVYKGSSAYVMADILKNTNKTLYLFDTFCGNPITSQYDNRKIKNTCRDTSVEYVKNILSAMSTRIIITKGLLPNSINTVNINKICFIHLHLNLYESTLYTLEKLYDYIVPYGLVLIEDYCIEGCQGVRKAIQKFLNKYSLLIVPTGQAIMIKQEE